MSNQLKYYLIFFAALLIALVGYLIGRKNRIDQVETDIKDDAENLGLDWVAITQDAQEVYRQLGLDGPFGLSWPWENEVGVIRVIRRYDAVSFPLLSRTYNHLYGRVLSADLRKYLSESEYADLAPIIL
jgi:hypothetical protein